ncbi:hypothetical protein BH11PSE11_BH11PSE11_16490 [soil metagenome]
MSQQMLSSARQGEWEMLVEISNQRARLVEQLQNVDHERWPEDQGLKKAELIHSVLAADKEIQTLTEAWLTQLQVWGGSPDQLMPNRDLNRSMRLSSSASATPSD